ncbi:long-chain-fatty-acid--CoA ligase [Bacillus horti]|uniref:Long-chain acyl-CoA synthetase n=1 Tax=Caldalkalibacillus horti TaxID=77523 RepID=A0ABT9VUZ4_9BACI|nr:long-chain fatty acid--CoA ligase [Bacillus horti]MDQ0164445.1 long-chain acyl-CoA synthetase [Bacillus horti]
MYENKPWSTYYPPELQLSYDYPEHNLADFLKKSARQYPAHKALEFMGREMTYTQLYEATCRFANALHGLGIKKGDRVAIMLPNSPQAIISYYGSLMLGAIVVETNPLYTERELLHLLNDSGAELLVTLDILMKRIKKVQPDSPLKHVIVTSIKDYLPFPKNLLYPLKAKKDGLTTKVNYTQGIHPWSELLGHASSEEIQVTINPKEDLALLQYTSGTTGAAKGVMLTHYSLVANTIQARKWMYQTEDAKEIFLAALPFFHVYGMTTVMNLAMYTAGTLLLIPKFDIDLILKVIDKKKPTIFPGAPTMYISVINHPKIHQYDLSSINICISGSAPLPLEVQEKFEALTKGRLVEGYGLTEASPVTHANMLWEKRKLGSIGLPWPDTEAKVVDLETGQDIPLGEIGELAVKGPQLMKGYWNKEQATQDVLKDGWLLTGDIAKMDEEGFFYITDRKKDMIIAGGFNIYPREVEEVLFEHPKIQEGAVVGISDKYRGETVKAFIVLKQGERLTEEELDQWCRERLAAYKVPRIYEFREDLPKTMVGKVLKRKLIEEEEKKSLSKSSSEKIG